MAKAHILSPRNAFAVKVGRQQLFRRKKAAVLAHEYSHKSTKHTGTHCTK